MSLIDVIHVDEQAIVSSLLPVAHYYRGRGNITGIVYQITPSRFVKFHSLSDDERRHYVRDILMAFAFAHSRGIQVR